MKSLSKIENAIPLRTDKEFTTLPNWVFDTMHLRTPVANVVYFTILRKTIGFQKNSDRISNSQFEKICNLSRPSVIRAKKELYENGWIMFDGEEKRIFAVNRSTSLEQLKNFTSETNESKVFTHASKEFLQEESKVFTHAGKEFLHTKEKELKEKENKSFKEKENLFEREKDKKELKEKFIQHHKAHLRDKKQYERMESFDQIEQLGVSLEWDIDKYDKLIYWKSIDGYWRVTTDTAFYLLKALDKLTLNEIPQKVKTLDDELMERIA